MNKAAFLDRDGVINRKAPEGNYVTRWEQFEILPGVPGAITSLNLAGYRVVVVSNQRCVAKGLISANDLDTLHQKMRVSLAATGAILDGIYYCPHELDPPCSCRKPAPGMLFDAAHDHAIDLHNSWMIGDSIADTLAGRAAGCRTVLLTENGSRSGQEPDIRARNLSEAVSEILVRDAVKSEVQMPDPDVEPQKRNLIR